MPKGRSPFSWVNPLLLIQARNDVIARRFGDPTNEERRRWVAAQLASGEHPDFIVNGHRDESNVSFLLLGDPGEGDASQYAVVPPILRAHRDTNFMFVCSDVVYPAGDVNEYEDKFYRPYRDYPGPIYAIPGNHDWYDGLTGFMHHFCHNDGCNRPASSPTSKPTWKLVVRRILWRNPEKPDMERLQSMKALRGKPEQQAHQPGPYFALDTGPLLLIGIDTGIRGTLDLDQARWLRHISQSPKPKILLTGAPIYTDGTYVPGEMDGGGSVDDVVRNPIHNYVAAIGGNTHNYQRYPVKMDDGRVIQYIVSGGGGAYMTGTHKIPRVELPGVNEDEFRCYPLRGDSLSVFSRNLDHRMMRGRFHLTIPPAEAAALMSERLGIAPTRREDRQVVVTERSRRAFRVIFPRRVRLTGLLHDNYAEWLDWNHPPMFKSFLRIDASGTDVRIRCFAVTGCRAQEEEPAIEDSITAERGDHGRWRWSEWTD